MVDDLLGVLPGELLVFVVALNGLLDFGHFVLGQVATTVFVLFPGVETVIGAVRSLADNAEGAVLHALDLQDLFEDLVTRAGQFWNDIHQSSQQAFRAWVEGHVPWLWDSVFKVLLDQPVFAVMGILGLILMILFRPRAPLIGYSRD